MMILCGDDCKYFLLETYEKNGYFFSQDNLRDGDVSTKYYSQIGSYFPISEAFDGGWSVLLPRELS